MTQLKNNENKVSFKRKKMNSFSTLNKKEITTIVYLFYTIFITYEFFHIERMIYSKHLAKFLSSEIEFKIF